VGHQALPAAGAKSVRLTGRCACTLRRIYFVNHTASELRCRIVGRCDSGRSSVTSGDPVGPVSLQTPPEHRPTAWWWPATCTPGWSGRRPASPWVRNWRAAPGPVLIDCVHGLGRFYNLGCPEHPPVGGAWPDTRRHPATPRPSLQRSIPVWAMFVASGACRPSNPPPANQGAAHASRRLDRDLVPLTESLAWACTRKRTNLCGLDTRIMELVVRSR
jgi:hypothetical protein